MVLPIARCRSAAYRPSFMPRLASVLVRAVALKRRRALTAAVVLVLSNAGCAQAQPGNELAAQWQALRSQRGHFDGAAWNADVDRWQGRKHVLMQALATQAMSEQASRELLTQRMGTPDAIWRAGDAAHASATQQARWQGAPQGELMVYHWRGQHDQLLFAIDKGRVVATGWLMALE
jgi:hypothetical protein